MAQINIPSIIKKLIDAGNAYDTDAYLSFYNKNAILDDPSVGRKFVGHHGIREYFESYFIGYKTQTALKKLDYSGEDAHLEVQFTGDFPGGIIMGTFDFKFSSGKISAANADLI
jgi:ketosteroid isomerase-like protein